MSTSYPGFSPTRPYGARENLGTRLYLYMAESANGQGEANPVFWLAIGAGKIGPSCRSILRWSCEKNFFFWLFRKSIIDQVCFIKMAECWPVLFFFAFFVEWFYWENFGVLNRWSLMEVSSTLFDVIWCTHSYVQTTVSYVTVYSPHPLPSGLHGYHEIFLYDSIVLPSFRNSKCNRYSLMKICLPLPTLTTTSSQLI